MSLHVICSNCDEEFAYYNGMDIPEAENYDENTGQVFMVAKVDGRMGVCWDKTTHERAIFLCRDCFETFLPRGYKMWKEEYETA